MKIVVMVNYRKQSATPCHMLCLPKTTLTQLQVQVDQTGGPQVVLMKHLQVDEVLKVNPIDVGCTLSTKMDV